MLRRRLYYLLKPYIPWRVRVGVRGYFAKRKRARVSHLWPIDPASSQPPENWQGWPDNRQFAFVITHDVEGPVGLANCRRLAEVEMEYGFRSSFNFIPEGDYSVPAELRSWLTDRGFEVGVHDLHHDGKLFSSRAGFLEKAKRINSYLHEWGAAGYRSGFMLRNLEWYHDLRIQYDASTFDTDPFEPQPDSARTIFPFWVQSSTGHQRPGYVELPYTLPQDSTLFLVLRERTPSVWLNKLDWVAQHGGMALVNVHPDYLQFPGEPANAAKFPVEYYRQLLEHVRTSGSARVWHALPRDVARHVEPLRLPPPVHRPKKRVCIITYSFYECDTRVFRYGETLAAAGDHVDVLSIASSEDAPREELIDGCHVHRLQVRSISEKSRSAFILPLLKFLLRSSWWLTRSQLRQKYDAIHVHNLPDFLVFSAWLPKLMGCPIILDIHDLLPELYANKFKAREGGAIVKALKFVERASAAFSDHVILANHLWLSTYTQRSAPLKKCSVVINYVENRIFFRRPRTRNDDRLIVLFPGSLQWHQGLDLAVTAFVKVAREFPKAELHIYGDGPAKPQLKELAASLDLSNRVYFSSFIPTKDVADVMANADVGIVPKRADSFGNEAYSTKIMEFMSLGVPVVVARTKIDQYYFTDDLVRFFEPGNSDALADGIIDVLKNHALREQLVRNASAYAESNRWDNRKTDYIGLINTLSGKRQEAGVSLVSKAESTPVV